VISRKKQLIRAIFPTILSEGRRFSSPNLTIVVSKGAQGYAVIVPKKVARLSVTRHKIKRRVFEALRTISFPGALIVFPRSSVSSVSYQDIEAELAGLLLKIKH